MDVFRQLPYNALWAHLDFGMSSNAVMLLASLVAERPDPIKNY